MKRHYLLLVVFCIAFLFSADLSAQTGIRCHERVTPDGVETVVEIVDPFQGTNLPGGTSPGAVWNYPDGGLAWIARQVSVGDRGTQACSIMELNNEKVELFSIFDSDPPTPIWSDSSIFGTDTGFMCSSSFTGDYHVVMYHVNSPDIMNRVPYVNCYTSSSPTPIWTWNYESTLNAGTKVAIDREATVVVIALFNDKTGMVEIFVLDPADGSVQNHDAFAGGYLRGFDLSADGSTLYLHEDGTNVHIIDVATLNEVFSTSTSGSFDGHCISGDGSKFAFGGFGNVKVWENTKAGWASWSYSTGSGNYADDMDFSDDGSTLGFGVTQYSPASNKTEAYMMDIATKTVTAHVVHDSNGTYQDTCSAASISHDGRYFALATWGDALNANPEVVILENGVGQVGAIDTRGSAFGVDISWDGQITVSGCKAVHANISGNGGDVDCYTLGNEDMELVGPPIIGDKVDMNVYTNPDWFFLFILGTVDDPMGTAHFPFGTLYLDLTSFHMIFPIMATDSTGFGSATFKVCDEPAIVGMTVYSQAIFSEKGGLFEFSDDYLTMTLLPK